MGYHAGICHHHNDNNHTNEQREVWKASKIITTVYQGLLFTTKIKTKSSSSKG